MTVLGSGEVCWEKQACTEFISLKSDGGGLRKHVENSILGKTEKNSSPSQSNTIRSNVWKWLSFKNGRAWQGIWVAEIAREMSSGLPAVLFFGGQLIWASQETSYVVQGDRGGERGWGVGPRRGGPVGSSQSAPGTTGSPSFCSAPPPGPGQPS